MTRRGWSLFLAMALIWGIPYLLIKFAVAEVPPVFVVFCRTAIGAAILLPIAAHRGELRGLGAHWRPLLAFAVIEMAVPWLLLSDAETHVPSSFAALLLAATPLVGAVLASATKADDRLDRGRAFGLLLGLTGVGALVGLDVRAGDAWAVVAVVLVAIGYAVGPLILTRHMNDLPGVGIAAASLAIAAVIYTPWALTRIPSTVPSGKALVSLLLLALVCTALAFVVFFALIREVGAARSTVITYLNPVVAIALGLSLGNERFSVGMAIGFPLVLAGSFLATRRAAAPVLAPADEELQAVTP